MKTLRNLACATVIAAAMCVSAGIATAEEELAPNHSMAPGVWYCKWMGPTSLEFGVPDNGVNWQNDFTGEVRYVDPMYLSIALDESGDVANFYLYEQATSFTPSIDGVRVGSKVEVRSDDRHRARWVKTIPFYQWLKNQDK